MLKSVFSYYCRPFDYYSKFDPSQRQAHSQFVREEACAFFSSFYILMLGIVVQKYPDVLQSYPEAFASYLRHHLNNVVDVVVGASAVNFLSTWIFKTRSNALRISATFMAFGVHIEWCQYQEALQARPDAALDWVDIGHYIGFGSAYSVWRDGRYKKLVRSAGPEMR